MSKSQKFLIFKSEALFQKNSLAINKEFRQAISDAIKKSQYSREQIVEKIEFLTGIRFSKHILDQSTSNKIEYRFPAEVLHAFCLITGSIEPLKILANSIGCEVITPEETKEIRLFRLYQEKKKIEMQIKALEEGHE